MIIGVGYSNLFLAPVSRHSRRKLCLHAVRIKIPRSMHESVLPAEVLLQCVEPRSWVQLLVQPKHVARARQLFTALLLEWQPKVAQRLRAIPWVDAPRGRSDSGLADDLHDARMIDPRAYALLVADTSTWVLLTLRTRCG